MNEDTRIRTGVDNLDPILHGGLPPAALIVVAGPPGSGKTILAQQMCFHNASPEAHVLYVNTLSEPTAKALRYLGQLTFFDAAKVDRSIRFVDLGVLIRQEGLLPASALILEQVKEFEPALVVIDSFKVFEDLARSTGELRRFSYELAVNLMAWQSTALLLGEYEAAELGENPLFSIVDGIVTLTQRELSGERQRALRVVKMRGTEHSLDEHPFVISAAGVRLLVPGVLAARSPPPDLSTRCPIGISKLDDLLGGGVPRGAGVLVAGAAGTGKTILQLEFVYRGALAGERGLFVAFEESRERLLATARSLGWELDRQIEEGMVEILVVPQPQIRVDVDLVTIEERVLAMNARRVAIDSVSVLLYNIDRPQLARDKLFQLTSVVRSVGAVGLFAIDIPYGGNRISRLGVEETVVDGIILLTLSEEGLERQRYLEVYKLRNANHLRGRHTMVIGPGGVSVFPRYSAEVWSEAPPLEPSRRLSTGVDGLDRLLGGGLLERSVSLLAGSAGIGKSTLGVQFIIEGARVGEPGVYFTLEEGTAQLLGSTDALGLPLRRLVEGGAVEIVHLSLEHVRTPQFLSILADKIKAHGARRVVLDGARHMISGTARPEDLQALLQSLVARFKLLGATSILLVESASLYSADLWRTGLSPVADNLLMMRYARLAGRLQPVITVVKTRGSAHDWATHRFAIGLGGVKVEARATPTGTRPAGAVRRRKRKNL